MPSAEKLGSAFVELALQTGEYFKNVEGARKVFQNFALELFLTSDLIAGTLSRIGKALTIGVTAPIVALGVTTTRAAAKIQVANQLIDREFKGGADAVRAWASEIAAASGQSFVSVTKAVGGFQLLLLNMGVAGDKAQILSQRLTEVGLEQAALRGISSAEVFERFTSALVGNSAAVRQLGINTSDAAMEELLLASGVSSGTKELSQQSKTLVRLQILLNESAIAEGAIGDNAKRLAALLTRLGAVWERLTAEIGLFFEPVTSVTIALGSALVSGVQKAISVIQFLPFPLRFATAAVVALIAVIGPLIVVLTFLAVISLKVALAVKVWAFATQFAAISSRLAAIQTAILARATWLWALAIRLVGVAARLAAIQTAILSGTITVLGFTIRRAILTIPILGALLVGLGFVMEWLVGKLIGGGLPGELDETADALDGVTNSIEKADSAARKATGLRTLGSIGLGLLNRGGFKIPVAADVSGAGGVMIGAEGPPVPTISSVPSGSAGERGGRGGLAQLEALGTESVILLRQIAGNTQNIGLA